MNKKLAILSHSTRSNEVIELLEMLGGKNKDNADGCSFLYYTLCTPKINNLNNDKVICGFTNLKMQNDHFAIFTLEKFWKKYPYKVGDKAVYEDDNDIVVISEIIWDDAVGDIFYNVKMIDEDYCFWCPPEVLKPYKDNMNENKCTQCVYAVNNNHCGLRGFRYCSAQNVDKLPNGFELQEDGYFSWVNKKPKYPKTFEECLNMLYCKSILRTIIGHKAELLLTLEKLLICRDAYWKIAGEEMGLGKPWELSIGIPIYYIYYNRTLGTIKKDYADDIQGNVILAFPTEEMRDVFYENFKELIESCKELL